jgi:DNA topoisomerase VI subunit A
LLLLFLVIHLLFIFLEKETVFRQLIENYQKTLSILHMILVCGCGNPTFTTRDFIRIIQKNRKLTTLGLFDYNPGSFNIFNIERERVRESAERVSE